MATSDKINMQMFLKKTMTETRIIVTHALHHGIWHLNEENREC